MGERCKLTRWGLGEASADKQFGAYWRQKVQLRWQQLSLIFLRTNVIFCTKTSLISYCVTIFIIDCHVAWSTSSRGGALRGVFLLGQSPPLPWESRRLCSHVTGIRLLQCEQWHWNTTFRISVIRTRVQFSLCAVYRALCIAYCTVCYFPLFSGSDIFVIFFTTEFSASALTTLLTTVLQRQVTVRST